MHSYDFRRWAEQGQWRGSQSPLAPSVSGRSPSSPSTSCAGITQKQRGTPFLSTLTLSTVYAFASPLFGLVAYPPPAEIGYDRNIVSQSVKDTLVSVDPTKPASPTPVLSRSSNTPHPARPPLPNAAAHPTRVYDGPPAIAWSQGQKARA